MNVQSTPYTLSQSNTPAETIITASQKQTEAQAKHNRINKPRGFTSSLRYLGRGCQSLTCDLDHAVFGLHHQVLGGKVVDIQADLPAVLGLLDLGHAGAQLSGEGAGVGRWRLGNHGHLGHLGHRGHLGHLGHLGHHGHMGLERGDGVGDGRQALAHISGPVGAGERGEVLVQGGHAEGLVKQTAALVPVTEGVPARGAEVGEWNAPLSHVCGKPICWTKWRRRA